MAHAFAIAAFSDSLAQHGTIKSSVIFTKLMAEKRWYFPRASKAILIDATVFFYQSRIGIVGEADIAEVRSVTQIDRPLLNQLGLGHLTVAAEIVRVNVYSVPVELSKHVIDLHFVANKVYWGHSLRFTPRTIDDHDARLLRTLASVVRS
jgi:hypothetical protein